MPDDDRERRGAPAQPARRATLAAAIGIVLATLAVYGQTAGHGFVSLDDPRYVSQNPHVARGLGVDGLAWAFTTGEASNWHPLTWVSHLLDATLFGVEDAGPHHLVNVALHATASVLLLFALVRMTRDLGASAFVAALFALHPLHVESVAWVSERKDVLSGVFWMLTMLAYARYAERPDGLRYATVALCLALGLLAKPVLVTLPCVLLLLDHWPLERWRSRHDLRRLVVEKLPLLGLAAVSSIVTFSVQRGAMEQLAHVPLAHRTANAVVAYAVYLRKLVWPRDLAPFYPHPFRPGQEPLSGLDIAVAALLLAALSAAAVRAARRGRRYASTGWLWYLGTLVPMIGIVQVGRAALADRYTYLPAIGLFLVVAWGGRELLSRGARWLPAAAAATVLVACAVQSHHQAALWRDDFTLFAHTVRVTRHNATAETVLGLAHWNAGRAPEARAHLERAVAIHPDVVEARDLLGRILLEEGASEAALPLLERASAVRPDDPRLAFHLGVAYSNLGETAKALAQLARAAALDPDEFEARDLRGRILVREKDYAAAATVLEEAAALRSEDARVQLFAARAALGLDDGPTARHHLERALALRPDPELATKAHRLLARELEKAGELDAAAREYAAVLDAAPDSPQALARLAWIHATYEPLLDPPRALDLANRALAAAGSRSARLLDVLAAAHAAHGDFATAVALLDEALAKLDASEEPQRRGLVARLEGYRRGEAVRVRAGS